MCFSTTKPTSIQKGFAKLCKHNEAEKQQIYFNVR